MHQSSTSKENFDDAQKRLFPDKPCWVLPNDVKTQWWSTYTMLECHLELKPAIQDMFLHEFQNHELRNKATPLEAFELSKDDFQQLEDIVYVLAPFKVAQEALEGDRYITLSLLPLLIHQI